MGEDCNTCAYQTSRWKACTNKRKKAKINQELLKEKGYCHDYIEKSILFSNFKAARRMYDFFISEAIEASIENAKKQEEEQVKKDRMKLREECTINGKFSCLELMRKCLSLGGFGKVINDSKRIFKPVAKS